MSDKELYVKTYDLCTGKIAIGNVNCIYDEDKLINCWTGTNKFCYENEKESKIIENNTMIWDKRNKRYVMSFNEERYHGYACFSTIVINKSEDLSTLLVSDEKIKFYWEWV